MRQLSLGGFLDKYIRELSGYERIDIAKMATDADTANPRLKEPLIVYASIKRPKATIDKLFANTSLAQDYESYFSHNFEASEEFFSTLPDNYKKLYRSYLSVKNQKETERQLKELYRQKILKIKESCGITDYRICKKFSVNSGNLHSFLYQGKTENISLEKTRQIYEYVSNQK